VSNIDPRWGSWKEAPQPIAESEIRCTYECDVAIVGAGISGVACACRAAQNGLRVIVLEKTVNWQARGGNIGVANSRYMRSRGYENDLAEIAREWIKRCGSRCDEAIVWRYLHNSENAMNWLVELVTSPEYGARPELQACLYRGETYKEIYGSHRFFDGPMAKKGMRPGAADAVFAMYSESVKLGVEYLFSTPAKMLEKENNRVTGVIGLSEDGYIRVKAKKGIALATGDIGGNDEMCADLSPQANKCAAKLYTPHGCNTGDGHRMGLWAGGAFEDTPFPIILHPQAYHFANYCFLFVDNEGKRFMNEDNYIQGKGNAMLRRNMTYAWSIIDGDWAQKIPATLPYGGGIFWDVDHAPDEAGFTVEGTRGLLERGMARGVVMKADTPEELACLIGIPEEVFAGTLRHYNEMCSDGKDTEFGKRAELMIALDKPPYYALKFGPAALAVVGGLRVGTDMDVQDENNVSVPGLYAIGNAAGGRYGMDYPMLIPGNSHGTALTFGYILGDILAGKEVL